MTRKPEETETIRGKALISICLAVLMIYSILLLPVSNAGENHPDPRGADIRDKLLSAVNKARSVKRICGNTPYGPAPPVSWSSKLATAARLHSEDMVSHDFFSHTGSDGSTAGQRISLQGYRWRACGENIAVGVPTVSSVVRGWLGSEGHCRNLMDPAFTEVGAGYAIGPYGGDPAARYWTLDLATGKERHRQRNR